MRWSHRYNCCFGSAVFRTKPLSLVERIPSNKWEQAMPVYVIGDIKVTNDAWVKDYATNVHNLVHKHGGKYLSRCGNVKTLEGKPLETTVIALLEFPSADAVQAFATDPDYAPYAAARQAGSESRLQLLDDTDLVGTIPYLRNA